MTSKEDDDTCTIPECTHETHPWRTFDYEQVRDSKRFAYLADPIMKSGYSIQKTKFDVFLSLFAWHNETINVWSHLLGGIFFIVLLYSWGFSPHTGFASPENATCTANVISQQSPWTSSAESFSHMLSEKGSQFVSDLKMSVSQLPETMQSEMSRHTHSVQEWMQKEKRALDVAWKDLGAKGAELIKRTALFEYLRSLENATHGGLDESLREKLGKIIPTDFESRRALAALKGWLSEERRSIESLMFKLDPASSTVPVWPVLMYCFGSIMCLGCSAVYHWWVGYCQHTHDLLGRLDYAGISFMIWGSGVPIMFYVFYDIPFWRDLYLVGITGMSLVTLLMTAFPAKTDANLRIKAYYCLAALVVGPLFHAMYLWGYQSDHVRMYHNDGGLLVVGLLYVLGTVFYISRFPEKYFPRTFDFFLASHQIWHAMVFLAAYVHYFGAVELYYWRVEYELLNKGTAEGLCIAD